MTHSLIPSVSMTNAYAYIRKSVVLKGAATLSWEMQEQDVRALAARHGDTELVILSDWGKSGRLGAAGRPGYKQLLEAIDNGQVATLYAYSLSRLSRSLVEYSRLAALCVKAGVKVRLAKEGETDFTTPSGRLIVTILAGVAQMEAELAQERARDMVRARRARGDRIGQGKYGERPKEDVQAVIDAYHSAGSLHGAARLLNKQNVPTRLGGPWRGTSVKSVLRTGSPGILGAVAHRGATQKGRYRLQRLLLCQCGSLLSPQLRRGKARYWCTNAAETAHPMPHSVSEEAILPWIKAEVEGAGPADPEIAFEIDHVRRDELIGLLARNKTVFLAGDMEEAEYLGTKKTLDAELQRLDSEGQVQRLVPPDWDQDDPGLINEWLRALVSVVHLDASMQPVSAEWLLPAWRRARLAA